MQTYSTKTSKTSNKHLLLKLEDVCVKYASYTALRDVSFSLEQGEYLYVVGPNGSGKTTLIKLLTRLLQPTTGNCLIQDFTCGYLPQKLNTNRMFPITVEEVIYSGFLKQKFRISTKDRVEIRKWLEIMQISDLLKKPISVLSGGQQQRVFLIRALISAPDVLILDEPTSALDPSFRSLFNSIIFDLNKKGTTIVYVTHDLHDFAQSTNKVLYVDQEIKYYGDVQDYKEFIHGGRNNV